MKVTVPNLTALMTAKGLSTTEVAKRIGAAKQNVHRFQRGEVAASREQIARWAAAVGVTSVVALRSFWQTRWERGREMMREARQAMGRKAPGRPENTS